MRQSKVARAWLLVCQVLIRGSRSISSATDNIDRTLKLPSHGRDENSQNQNLTRSDNLARLFPLNLNSAYLPPQPQLPSPYYLPAYQSYNAPPAVPFPPYQNGIYSHSFPVSHSHMFQSPNDKGLMYPLPISHYQAPNLKPSQPFPSPLFPGSLGLQDPGFGALYPQSGWTGYFNPGNRLPYKVSHPLFGNPYQRPFDIGSLPNQVRVPVYPNVQIDPERKILQIVCEFPRYLMLMQAIYWHFRYNDPYGTYFDDQNGFGPRVTVKAADPWKSVLTIDGYTDDDHGIYRCLSTAILPSLPGTKSTFDLLQLSTKTTPSYQSSTTSTSTATKPASLQLNDATLYDYDSKDQSQFTQSKPVKKRRNSRIMKFPSNRRSMQVGSSDSDPYTFDNMVEIKSHVDNQIQRPSSDELNKSVYDLFESTKTEAWETKTRINSKSKLKRDESTSSTHAQQEQAEPSFINNFRFRYPNIPSSTGTNTFVPSTRTHSGRHFLPGFGQFDHEFKHGWGPSITPPPPSQQPLIGLNAPYYKPSFGFVTVYQEVTFPPPGLVLRGSINRNVLNPFKLNIIPGVLANGLY